MNIDEIFSKGASYLISEKGYEDYISVMFDKQNPKN